MKTRILIALCDVDDQRAAKVTAALQGGKTGYKDFRILLE